MGSDTEISTCYISDKKKPKESERFVCPYKDCCSVFNRQWKLDGHICSHTGERPFKCQFPGCDKDYTRKQHLQRHILLSHKKVNVPVVYISCPYSGCLKQFQNKYSLKKHCKSHQTVDFEYKCLECDIKFKKRNQYISHLNKHKGLLPFTCTTCSYGFASEKELANHEKKHKVYICEYADCQGEFPTWSLLRKHFKLKHPRCYVCDFCSRSYANKNTLMRHILVHLDASKQDVYPCPYKDCLRYYKYKSNLNHHVEVMHKGKRYKCTEEHCTSVFRSKNRLVSHQNRHKNGEISAPVSRLSDKKRKPRKDKGLKKKSKAVLLSGIYLPPEIEKRIAQNTVTPEVNENIEYTLKSLKEDVIVDTNEEECTVQDVIHVKETNPSQNVLLFVCSNAKSTI